MENTFNSNKTNFENDPNENESEYVTEYSTNKQFHNMPKQNFLDFKRRPKNSLDYMKFQSEDYHRFKIEKNVKARIKELNLGNNLETQIFEVCFNFYKKFRNNTEKIRLFDLVPIVAYKIIKHNNLPLSHKTVIEKLKLDKSKFLKYSNQIQIGEEGVVFKIEGEDSIGPNNLLNSLNEKENLNSYVDKVFDYVQFMIRKLSEFYQTQPNSLKIKDSKNLIDFYLMKLENMETLQTQRNFFDTSKFLEEVKKEAKILIYGVKEFRDGKKLQFVEFFYKKVLIEHFAAAIIKHLSDVKGVRINLQIFKDVFDIPSAGISRVSKLLTEYFNIINKCKEG